jgi:hypothetical protein
MKDRPRQNSYSGLPHIPHAPWQLTAPLSMTGKCILLVFQDVENSPNKFAIFSVNSLDHETGLNYPSSPSIT